MKTKKLATLSLFTAIALAIYCLEAALPPLAPIPGVKPGLANVITLILLLRYTGKDAFLVLFMRIFLGSIFGGQIISFFYSISGGTLCFFVMLLLNHILNKRYICLTSIFGAIAHNIGQLLAAWLLTNSAGVFLYLPYMMISAVITGLFTGLCSLYINRILVRAG